MTFSPPVLGCLVKNGLQKEGSGAPQDPQATPLGMCKKNYIFLFFYALAKAGEVKFQRSVPEISNRKLTENDDTQRFDPKF